FGGVEKLDGAGLRHGETPFPVQKRRLCDLHRFAVAASSDVGKRSSKKASSSPGLQSPGVMPYGIERCLKQGGSSGSKAALVPKRVGNSLHADPLIETDGIRHRDEKQSHLGSDLSPCLLQKAFPD